MHSFTHHTTRAVDPSGVAAIALTLGLPALVVVPSSGIEPGVHAALKLACLALAAAAWGWAGRHRDGFTPTERHLLIFVVLAVATTVTAGIDLTLATPGLVSAVALLLITRGVRVHLHERWRMIEAAVLLVAVGVAALGLLELLGLHLPWAGPRRPESTLGNRNFLAGYLVIALPIAVAAALRGRRLALPAITLLTLVIGVTRCRGAYLAALAALALALVVTWMRRRTLCFARGAVWATLGALVLGLGLSAVSWPGVRFAPSVPDALDASSSTTAAPVSPASSSTRSVCPRCATTPHAFGPVTARVAGRASHRPRRTRSTTTPRP